MNQSLLTSPNLAFARSTCYGVSECAEFVGTNFAIKGVFVGFVVGLLVALLIDALVRRRK